MELAPVLVSVYNRIDQLKICIDSLRSNIYAKETILYIVSDNYSKNEDQEIIKNIRKYIKSISGFKEVRYIFNEINKGSHWSIRNAIDKVLQNHDKLIFLEDDIEVSIKFLEYMNDGLLIFENNKEIFSICSYTPSDLKFPKSYDKEIYLWSRNSPWGFATWRDRWTNLDLELETYDDFEKDKKQVKRFRHDAPMSLTVLRDDRKGKIQALDVRISYNMFKNNQYSVYPKFALCKNNGFDGSGEHSKKNNKFLSEVIYQKKIEISSNISIDKKIYAARKRWHTSILQDYIIPTIEKYPKLYKKLKLYKNILAK